VKAAARGVTLVEVLIVLTILTLISGGVVVGVLPQLKKAQIETAKNNAVAIRHAVTRWKLNNSGGECPTMSQLIQDKQIDSASKATDPWDSQYKITCEGDEIYVTSAGPDKKEGTDDDIRVPEKGGRN